MTALVPLDSDNTNFLVKADYLFSKGFYVEPATATTFAGFIDYYKTHKEEFTGKRCCLYAGEVEELDKQSQSRF
ncbi:MAG: hypothetical protein ACLKAK_01140 [Alkaliphilus sp.]